MWTIIIVIVVAALLVFLYLEDKWIVVTPEIYTDSRIPDDFNNLRILHVSDLQSAYFGKHQDRLIKKASQAEPDYIFFTGDLVDRNRTNLRASMEAVSRLQEIAPVYFVTGNHELALGESLDDLYEEMKDKGIILLFDENTEIRRGNSSICITGISDETLCSCKLGEKRSDTAINPEPLINTIDELMNSIPENCFTIMLTHEPQFFNQYVRPEINLVFAGHAHGGQIRLPFTDGLFAPGQGILPKLTSGMRKKEDTTMIISRGLGNSIFPFRIFNRPELISVVLKKYNQ